MRKGDDGIDDVDVDDDDGVVDAESTGEAGEDDGVAQKAATECGISTALATNATSAILPDCSCTYRTTRVRVSHL